MEPNIVAGVCAHSPDGLVLITKGNPDKQAWKLPGGRYSPEEDGIGDEVVKARRTAIRKFVKETGISLPEERFVFKAKDVRERGTPNEHDYYLFTTALTAAELQTAHKGKVNGFTVHVLSRAQLDAGHRKKIPLPHHILIDKFRLWPY